MRKVLPKPQCLESDVSNLTSFCFCVMHALPYLKEAPSFSYEEVMGYSGHAFHINIEVERVSEWGVTMYDWNGMIPAGLQNLGIKTKQVDYSNFHRGVPDKLNQSISLIRDSIDGGIPVIMWEALNPEFALIYGYDDENQLLDAVDANSEGKIPYSRVGQGANTPELFVLAFDDVVQLETDEMLKGTIELILKYGEHDVHDSDEFSCGLAAYEKWIDVILKGNADAHGNAYNMAVVRNARAAASEFLHSLADRDLSITRAAEYMDDVVFQFDELAKLFPLPGGGQPNDDANEAIERLRTIKELEKSVLSELRQAGSVLV